jgi:hypothetical protein
LREGMKYGIKHSPDSGTFLNQKKQQHSHCRNEHADTTTVG